MTVVAAEAAAGRAAAGGAARAGTASRGKLLSDPRSGAKPLGNSDPGPSYERRGSESRSKPSEPRGDTATRTKPSSAASAPAAKPAAAKSPGRPRKSSGLSRAARTGRQFTAPEFRNYQGIILAEFVLAELLVAGTPIATRQGQAGLSPYVPRDMTKLLSLGMVYFLLELLAVGGPKAGRFGAWFGGLILLAVGLNEASSVAKVLDIFGSDSSGTKAADTGGGQNG